MYQENLSLTQKRAAIERGLSTHFANSKMSSVMKHWEENYGAKPSFVLNRFIQDICDTEELKQSRREILKQVIHEISTVEKQIKLELKEETSLTGELTSEYNEAFYFIVREMMRTISARDRSAFIKKTKQALLDQEIIEPTNYHLHEKEFLSLIDSKNYGRVLRIFYEHYSILYPQDKVDSVYDKIKHGLKIEFPYLDLKKLI